MNDGKPDFVVQKSSSNSSTAGCYVPPQLRGNNNFSDLKNGEGNNGERDQQPQQRGGDRDFRNNR